MTDRAMRAWRRSFNTAIVASFALLLAIAVNCYVNWDRSHAWQFGRLEIELGSASIRFHDISPVEQAWRDRMAARATVDRCFQDRRDAIDEDIQREPWGSPAYKAALVRSQEWRDDHTNYLLGLVPIPLRQQTSLLFPLPQAALAASVLPAIAIVLALHRSRDRFRRLLALRYYRTPYAFLTPWARVKRFAFTCVLALSLLLAIAVSVLWVRSYRANDWYRCVVQVGPAPNAAIAISGVGASPGEIGFWHSELPYPLTPKPITIEDQIMRRQFPLLIAEAQKTAGAWVRNSVPTSGQQKDAAWSRPVHSHREFGPTWSGGGIDIQDWAVVSALLLLPLIWLLSGLKRVRGRAGHCPRCDYNLTGNTSGVCPECGVRVIHTAGT